MSSFICVRFFLPCTCCSGVTVPKSSVRCCVVKWCDVIGFDWCDGRCVCVCRHSGCRISRLTVAHTCRLARGSKTVWQTTRGPKRKSQHCGFSRCLEGIPWERGIVERRLQKQQEWRIATLDAVLEAYEALICACWELRALAELHRYLPT